MEYRVFSQPWWIKITNVDYHIGVGLRSMISEEVCRFDFIESPTFCVIHFVTFVGIQPIDLISNIRQRSTELHQIPKQVKNIP